MEDKDPIWKHARVGKAHYDKPSELWNDAKRYFEWADNNPIKGSVSSTKSKRSNKNKNEENIAATVTSTTRPYTLFGLATFCGISNYPAFRKRYMARDGFSEVILMIENIVASQQIDNAMVGVFKESLTARLNNLDVYSENFIELDNNDENKFNGFSFLPHTEGLENSEETRIASGEVPMLNPANKVEEEPEPIYAEIITEDGTARTENQLETEGGL